MDGCYGLSFFCSLAHTFLSLANENHDTNSWRATPFKDTNIPFALQYWIAFTMTEGVENRASGGDSFFFFFLGMAERMDRWITDAPTVLAAFQIRLFGCNDMTL